MANRLTALSGGLSRYLESVEDFFPYAATQHLLRQHSENARNVDQYSEEELQYLQEDMNSHLMDSLPRAILGSAFVVLYSAFESTVVDFAQELAKELSTASIDPSFKDGTRDPFPIKAERYFESVFDVRLFSNAVEKFQVNDTLRELRNSFVHKQSVFKRLPRRLRQSIVESADALTLCVVNDEVWVPRIACVKAHGALIRNWGRELCGRVVERLPSAL